MNVAARVQVLEDRIAELEELLGMGPDKIAAIRFLFSGFFVEAKLLGLMLRRRVVGREMAFAALYGDRPESEQPCRTQVIDVYICRLRKALKGYGVEIRTEYKIGWSIAPADKAMLEALIQKELAAYEIAPVSQLQAR